MSDRSRPILPWNNAPGEQAEEWSRDQHTSHNGCVCWEDSPFEWLKNSSPPMKYLLQKFPPEINPAEGGWHVTLLSSHNRLIKLLLYKLHDYERHLWHFQTGQTVVTKEPLSADRRVLTSCDHSLSDDSITSSTINLVPHLKKKSLRKYTRNQSSKK